MPPHPALLRTCALAAALTAACGPGFAVQKSESKTQMEFGVKVALKGSWNEAAFRFERATKADPASAHAWNNYAVALERLGRFDDAAAAYGKARALDPEDGRIQENEERLKSFLKYRTTHTPEATPAPPSAEAPGKPDAP